MILAVDVGNTRLKWGLCAEAGAEFHTWGVLGHNELDRLDEAWRALPQPSRIAIASVAGAAANARTSSAAARFGVTPTWLVSPDRACGVTNSYDEPAQLGIDRFAALVAAHARAASTECLVVMVGTATTVDILAADGVFRGGLILPGPELMKQALAAHTAQLPLARGVFRGEPRNTADAIESGCLHAQAGAIERLRGRLGTDAVCFVSGGGAAAVLPQLAFRAQIVEHLVLEGAARLAVA